MNHMYTKRRKKIMRSKSVKFTLERKALTGSWDAVNRVQLYLYFPVVRRSLCSHADY